jgi:predicted Zn-dependent peptidase
MYNYNGPMMWMADLVYDQSVSADSIIRVFDEAVTELSNVSQEDTDLAMVKLRSDFYNMIGGNGIGRADLLAVFALFDDNPSRINSLEDEFRKVTPDLIKKTAAEYLRTTNRSILIVDPKASQ